LTVLHPLISARSAASDTTNNELLIGRLLSNCLRFSVTRSSAITRPRIIKDPDFDPLKGIIKLHPLPPKPGKTT
jgi:hypothetical protein